MTNESDIMQYIFILGIIIIGVMSVLPVDKKIYMLIIVTFLSYFAYIFSPPVTFDLYRHFDSLEKLRMYGEDSLVYVTAPLSRYFFWSISYLGDNHMLPLVTCIMIYGISFYSLKIICDYYDISRLGKIIIFLYVAMFEYPMSFINIRFPISVSIFLLAFIIENLKQHKKIGLILYLVSLFFHPGIFLLLIIRFLAKFNYKKLSFVIMPFCFVMIIFQQEILSFLFSFFLRYFGNAVFIFGIQEMISGYTNEHAFKVAPVMLLPDVIRSLFLIVVLIMLPKIKVSTKKANDIINRFCLYALGFSYITLITGFSNGNFFARIAYVFPMLGVICLASGIAKNKYRNFNFTRNYFLITYLFVFALWSVFLLKTYHIILFPFI